MKKLNVITCCITLTCLLLISCKEEDYLLRRGNREAESGDYKTAIKFYNKALEINPHNEDLYYNRGLVWYYMKEMDKSIADYTTALEINNEYKSAYYNRGITLYEKGDYELAIDDYNNALRLYPDNFSKAGLYFHRARAWFKIRDYDRAIDDYTTALRIGEDIKTSSSDKAEVYSFRAGAWDEKGNLDKAIADYTKSIELNPKYAHAVFNRANIWHEKREYASAIIDYEKAIELDPQNAHVYNNYSWLLSTCPDSRFRDGSKALKLALKAVEINPDEVLFLDTLAAAYAELGNFKEAVQAVEKAITLLKKDNNEELMNDLIPQLESYKAGKPWREDVKREDWMRGYKIKERDKENKSVKP